MTIIGRLYEKKQLEKIFQSNQAEFVAVYGRRRVGKTYLIREFFNQKKCIFFRSSGVHKGSTKSQLEKFKKEIETTFYADLKGLGLPSFLNWHDAFEALTNALASCSKTQKVVIFLDELPWMATPKSGLLEALDYYWNRHWSENKRVKLIICGSAASWIIENVLQDTGGLHNRVTLRLPIAPFLLLETKEYLQYKNIRYDNEQILTLYMCLGGVPFYLNFIEKGLSAIQNVNNICFNKKGTLYDEFDLLFASLFKKHDIHESIITFIASKREGVSRGELESQFEAKGGRLTTRLKELEEAGFIVSFLPWGKVRGLYYKVIDEYTLFYLTWIAHRATSRISQNMDDRYWEVLSGQASWKSWSGYAFEAVCFKHIAQIKRALHIPDGSDAFSWKYAPVGKNSEESGVQVDLVFDRPDNIVNLCEIKYYASAFAINKKYAEHLLYRESVFRKITKTKKQIMHSMIVSSGLKKTIHSEEIISSSAGLDDLFK